MKRKITLVLCLCLSLMLQNSLVLADDATGAGSGVTISSVSRLDLRSGIVEGEKAEYSLELPGAWRGYLIAEREKLGNTAKMLEKVDFYFQPKDRIAKPVFLMSLCVYRKYEYTELYKYHKLMESKRYVFSIKPADENALADKTDSAIFQLFMNQVNDDAFVINQIALPSYDVKLLDQSITVNGRLLSSRILLNNDTVYLPLREVCEAMGYKVGWLAKNRAITITKGDFYCLLTMEDSNANLGYTIIQKNDRAYISSLFLIRQLKSNLEIDERKNVFINTR